MLERRLVAMIVAVVMPAIVIMAVISAALGLERRLDGGELRTEPKEHLLKHMIAADAQAITGHLHLRVPVAEVPGEARQLVRVGDRKSTRLNSSHSQISYAV